MNRIINKNKEKGINGVIKSAFSRLYLVGYVYKSSLENLPSINSTVFEFRKMEFKDLEKIKILYCNEFSSEKFDILRKRLISNDSETPYIVLYNKIIAGYFHIAYKSSYDTTLKIQVVYDKDNIHLFDDYTFRIYRGKGVHKFSILSRTKLGKSKGYKTATVHIIKGNKYSENAYINSGFKRIKKISLWFHNYKRIHNL